jgi:hypothetical protein
VRDTHTYTYTYSYSHFNSAAYAHTQRQSNTKGSPDSASSPVKRVIWPRRKDIIAASQFTRRSECRRRAGGTRCPQRVGTSHRGSAA